jgi:6-pyruvoyltetrahydropterin/6-carboxytetrahydropterin synthase
MRLTVSKRLEFSASRRLFVSSWSDAENLAAFGPETAAPYGTGRNYVAYFVFSGEVNATTGMLVNISEIKARVDEVLHARFDHKFLNEDHPAFRETPPIAENVARQLLLEVAPLFDDLGARLVACHLVETPERSATFYSDGICEGNYWLEFSAARQTMSPHLSAAQNDALFGIAASPHGHGHHYRARFTFRRPLLEEPPGGKGAVPSPSSDATRRGGQALGVPPAPAEIARILESLRKELDHKNLNHEVAGLANRPKTTESIAQYVHARVAGALPVHRVRLHERDDFFAEYWSGGNYFLGMQRPFSAAHRLHAPGLSAAENLSLYGKCNSPRGHGHRYLTEATIGGPCDERSGTLYNFLSFLSGIDEALRPWQDKHLDLETEEFRKKPSTGENIVRALWPKFNARLDDQVVRLRLWETPNNRFTLRCR